MSLCTYVAFVLSLANYYVVCCYMWVWANYANDNNRGARRAFPIYKRNALQSNVMSFIALISTSDINETHRGFQTQTKFKLASAS